MPGLANGMGAAGKHLGGFAGGQTAGLNHRKRTMPRLANGMGAAGKRLVGFAGCLPARKPPKCFPAAPMPFASPGIVLLWWFKPAVCQPAKPTKRFPAAPMPFASLGIVLLRWFKPAVCPPAKPPKCFPAAPMPFASPGIVLLWWFKPAVCQPAKPPKCFPAAPMPFASPGIVLLWWFKPDFKFVASYSLHTHCTLCGKLNCGMLGHIKTYMSMSVPPCTTIDLSTARRKRRATDPLNR